MTDNDQEQGKAPLTTTALDHAWRCYELRMSCGLQLLNFFMLAIAVITTAYVSALKARDDVVSVAVALIGAAVTVSAYLAGLRQDNVARMALAPIQEVEGRLADALDLESLRIVEQYRITRKPSSYSTRATAHFVYPVAALICIAAAIYAAVIS
jgi:hypothetical protein